MEPSIPAPLPPDIPVLRGPSRIAYAILFITAFLLPVFFLPSPIFFLEFTKGTLLSLGATAAAILWIIGCLKEGTLSFPSSGLFIAFGLVLFVALLAGIFSGAPDISFIGQNFEMGTVGSLVFLGMLLFLTALLFASKDRIFYAYLAFFVAFFLVTIFYAARLIGGPDVFSFGVFPDLTSNPIGKWNDLGIFFGLTALLSLISIELPRVSTILKLFLYLALIASLFFSALVNLSISWITLALFSLIFFVYALALRRARDTAATEWGEAEASPRTSVRLRRIPITSLAVLIISLVFIFGGNRIGNYLATALNIGFLEARPSWGATVSVAQKTLSDHPLFGVGPNRFVNQWLLHKPSDVNQTVFWNADFNFGVGFIPTFLVTTGLAGGIAWLVFFIVYLAIGFRSLLDKNVDRLSRYLTTSSFLASLFLWLLNILYIPSMAIVGLTFFFTGLFIASLLLANRIRLRTVSFSGNQKTSFIFVLFLTVVLIVAVVLGYLHTERFLSWVYFQKGLLSFNRDGNLDLAESLFRRAATATPLDVYHRFLADIALIRLNQFLTATAAADLSANETRTRFQGLFGDVLGHARKAIEQNEAGYENWLTLGRAYEAVVPLRIERAYESAKDAYERARLLNPHNPAILLTSARLEVARGSNDEARIYIRRALEKKGNYTEAIFLLSQIEVAEGNLEAATRSVEAASLLAPNDPAVSFQLGLLWYNAENWPRAISVLERAVELNRSYANAKYFLGLAYERVGRRDDAIAQFEDLEVTNKDNAEVALILENLREGHAPFANAPVSIGGRPEQRPKPPVEEPATDRDGDGGDEGE